eukprot:scaffold9219_cov121-Cylindrotheca_fusiformis.AAC.1
MQNTQSDSPRDNTNRGINRIKDGMKSAMKAPLGKILSTLVITPSDLQHDDLMLRMSGPQRSVWNSVLMGIKEHKIGSKKR